jgi:hypothetical protein
MEHAGNPDLNRRYAATKAVNHWDQWSQFTLVSRLSLKLEQLCDLSQTVVLAGRFWEHI